ncbi:cyclic nucleotide-binding domain-containing protein [Archangium violaceum]|uniref:cyclic nucleotide-binding domain-containing protein n=1 Tax=Archangium violaceum TaxID=83451 RepID=UPI00194EC4B9|nr:cyclic nucleotide-binding domain-containing protein [Archangium violaceum]QRN98333.1 cyclic nucleotide-binding domain-containing protein [Archangium violaceum]
MLETLREHKDKAAQLFASGKLEEALAEYQVVVESSSGELASRQKVAELLQRLGRKQEAISVYEEVAMAWARQGWLLRAIALCKVILQLEPGHGRTQQMLADLYARRLTPQPRLSAVAPVTNTATRGPKKVTSNPLPRIPLFSQLSEEAFVAVLEELAMRTFSPGESIVQEGEPGNSLFAIVEGRADVVRQLAGGQRRKVASLGEGDFFGEMALLSAGPRLASVVAAERIVALELTRKQVDRLVQLHPSVKQVLRSFHEERLLANVLRSNPILSVLSPQQREALAPSFQFHSAAAGQKLLEQGQTGAALYIILRGQCRVTHQHPDGHESQYPVLREGDVFGELSVMLGLPATATVSADSACTLLRLDREAVERHVLVRAGVREALSQLSSERLQRTARLLSGQELHEGDQRV